MTYTVHHVCVTVHMLRSGDNWQNLVLHSPMQGPGIKLQGIGLGDKCLYPLSHPTDPELHVSLWGKMKAFMLV